MHRSYALLARSLVLCFSATLFVAASAHAQQLGSERPRFKGPLAQLVDALEEVRAEVGACNQQLASLRTEIDGVRSDLDGLGRDLRPCTPQRFLAGACGEDQHPFNLVVTLCGVVGAEANATASFSVEYHNTFEIGAGWDEALHLNFDRQIQFPGIPGISVVTGPSVYGVPFPDLEAGAGGYGGVEVSGCIEGVSIPIGGEIPRERVVALIAQLERGARSLQASSIHALESRDLTPERINATMVAVEGFQEERRSPAELGLKDPLELFQKGPLRQLADALPVGGRVQGLLDDPSEMLAPLGFTGSESVGALRQLCTQDVSDRPTLDAALVPVCDLLDSTPDFERVAASFELIGELPDEVTAAIAEILPEVDPGASIPPKRTGQGRKVCNALPFLPRCR